MHRVPRGAPPGAHGEREPSAPPIYRSSQGRWRAYQDHLGPLLAELDPMGSNSLGCEAT
jgi:hypothetical protein